MVYKKFGGDKLMYFDSCSHVTIKIRHEKYF